MKILGSLEKTKVVSPCGITIGNFDGVHRGHQELLRFLRRLIGAEGTLAVFTFSNHPTHILPGAIPIPLIYSLNQKLFALQELGTDITFLLPFTLKFASQPYDTFLKDLHQTYPFKYIVLGEKATLGKNREGTPEKLKNLGEQIGFEAIYISKEQIQGKIVSSQEIRDLIHYGNFKMVSELLGRPYSLQGFFKNDPKNPKKGVISIEGICHPREGEYPVKVRLGNQFIPALAKFRELSLEIMASSPLENDFLEIFF